MSDPKRAVQVLRAKLGEENEHFDPDDDLRAGCDDDRESLLAFSDELKLLREDYGWHRHEKLLRHNVRMSENAAVCLHDSILDDGEDDGSERFFAAKDVAKAVVRWIHDTYDIEDGSQETNRDYRVAFRLLAKHVTRGDEVPDTHEWISTKTSRDYDPAPDEADMLRLEDDVKPMVEAARNPRDACLIMLQFEGGFRGGELYDMRVGDITDGDHSFKVRVDGKRGEHDVHLILAVPYVEKWLSEHPGGQGDYVWSWLTKSKRYSYQRFLQCFTESAERAGVDRPVTPTNFRKSNAYWLAKRDKSQAFIEDRQGRARGSPVIARYVAAFSGETQEMQYAAMHGLDVDLDEPETETPPVACPRCEKQTPVDRDFCIHCNFSLDLEAKSLLDRVSRRLDEVAIEAEDPDDRAEYLKARRTINENPNVMDSDELHALASSLSVDDD